MFSFPRDPVTQTIARLLCVVIIAHLGIMTPGCGSQQSLTGLPGSLVQIRLTAGHPIKEALAATGFRDAEILEVNFAASRFRILFPDAAKSINGEFVEHSGAWEMTHFQFSSNGQLGEMFLDPATRQVTLIQTSQGDVWEPAKDSSAASRVQGSDRLQSYLASNSELIALSTEGKTSASFAFAPAFFIYIMIIWVLCADMHPIVGFVCPGFGPIFAVIVAILGGFPPPTGSTIPTNQPPNARDDSFSILSNTVVAGSVLTNQVAISDPDGDALTVSLLTSTTNGSVALQSGGSFTYTPNVNFRGTDSFMYQVSDGKGGTASGNVTITVLNRPPDARDDALTMLADLGGAAGNVFSSNTLGPDSDPEGDALTVIAVNGSAANVGVDIMPTGGGAVTLQANGAMTYFDTGFATVATFTYTISDGNGGTDSATVTINVITPP